MTAPTPTRVPGVPERLFGDPEEHLRRVCQAVNGLQHGQGNNHYLVTLEMGETETTLLAAPATPESVVSWTPRTANAAANPIIWYEVSKEGVITFHHNVVALAELEFGIVVNG